MGACWVKRWQKHRRRARQENQLIQAVPEQQNNRFPYFPQAEWLPGDFEGTRTAS
jgi:hypothetical protein